LRFRDPGDGFDVQRMDCEQCRHTQASPERAGHRCQKDEQQQRVGDVDCKARQMVGARIETEHLHVEHVRQPGQRAASGAVRVGERPRKIDQRQAGVDVGIVDDEIEVVIRDEVEVPHRGEDERRTKGKDDTGNGEGIWADSRNRSRRNYSSCRDLPGP
jgi:hypothetical protein